MMAVVMALLWLRQTRTQNAGIVDVAWAAGIGTLALSFGVVADGQPQRRWLVAGLGAVWAFRLAWHLFRRVSGEQEDGRYRRMREDWGDRARFNFFWFFQIQASWVALFAVPMFLAAQNPEATWAWTDVVAMVVWVIAVVGELVADRQLARFRSRSENRGRVCREGLWAWSRHPNYFFEWVHWWTYVFLGLAAPWGWLTILGPVLMLVFLVRVTGIPYTEAQAISSRGEAYREYQR
ncbi:MAG: DUF1295 domain-containing protein, partial [Planctomycetes bacterium]|nr:DUF1295 domain-containing protein [Planctomycetota bacterium]